MEVSKEEKQPVKIDPLWLRAFYLFVCIVAVPLLVYGVGYIGGLLWKLFNLGVHHGAN